MTLTHNKPARRQRPALVLLLATLAGSAWADDDRRGPRVPPLPQFQQECGACHLAFPPGLLPAQSWRSLMATLPRHFGTDASLDAATANAIGTWLAANAGSGKRASEAPPQGRITRSAWFEREHREVRAATWTLPAVKGPSNCAACHRGAEQGNFNEHDIQIPR